MDILRLDRRIAPLQRELDLRVARNQAIAANVANVDTPGYKAKDVDFKQVLLQSSEQLDLRKTDERHISLGEGPSAIMTRESQATPRPDGNNVQMEEEMLKLAQNNIEYNVLVQFVSKRLSGIRRNIDEIK